MLEARNLVSGRSEQKYRLYGLTMLSDFPFANHLQVAADTLDLRFECTPSPPHPVDWHHSVPVYATHERNDAGDHIASLHQLGDCDVLRLTGIADFYLLPGSIFAHLREEEYEYLVEINLLGVVLALWLERLGIPALHASAVNIEGQAVAFLSSNYGGKTSLVANLMQSGHSLLTDDLLPLERVDEHFLAHSGYPTMRMWPREAEYFLGHYKDLELIHPEYTKRRVLVGQNGFGSFSNAAQPLGCIYVPERCNPPEHSPKTEILPVSSRDAVFELVRHSFLPRVVEAIGLQPRRLELFTEMVLRVPVRRLKYPSGLAHLPQVRQTILGDLGGLRTPI
jgi:hypothetical protein